MCNGVAHGDNVTLVTDEAGAQSGDIARADIL